MNLFERIAVLLIALGLVIGLVGGAEEGIWPAFTGALSGAAKGFAVYAVWMLSILVTLALGLLYRPPLPRCRNGKCKARDYTYLSLDTDAMAAAPGDGGSLRPRSEGMLARCACGILYSRSACQRRVCEVMSDGTLVPYMYHRPLGRWQPHRRAV